MSVEQQELVQRGAVTAVRVHQETSRTSRIYSLEYSDGVQTWREPLWSVTTLLKAIDKPALVYWAAREVAAAAFKDRAHLDSDLARFGEREAIYQLSQAPWSRREKAADVGTAVHALIDAHVRGAELPFLDEDVREKAHAHYGQFLRFEADYRPVWHGAEMTVVNPEHGWAGTLDQLAEIGHRGLGLLDVKNTSPAGKKKDQPGVWPEHALQVCCYGNATEIIPVRGLWAEPVPMPEVKWGAVLWLSEERYALVEVDISAQTYRAFRTAAEFYRWQDGPGKRVILGEQSPAVFGVLPSAEEQEAATSKLDVTRSPDEGSPDGDAAREPEIHPAGESQSAGTTINEPQRRALEAMAREIGGHDALKAIAHEVCGVDSTTKIPAARFDDVAAAITAAGDPGSEAAA